MNNLIEVDELHEESRRQDPELVIVSVMPRWRYWLGHVPGSSQVWRPRLSAPGSSRLIDASGFSRWARSLGLHNNSKIVLIDEPYDAIRLWWAFQHYGHPQVRVLNGGLQAWRQAGLPTRSGPQPGDPGRRKHATEHHRTPTGTFQTRSSVGFAIATNDEIWKARNQDHIQLWDARDQEEWSGRKRLRGARRAGRIPWSRHLCWRQFRQGDGDGTAFRSDAELAALVDRHGVDPGKDQVVYCQSGVRSTTMLFALARLGWAPERLLNHDGSWREWSRNPTNPILNDADRAARGENAG
ncbi:MAG: sulfurtransferase [Cyanobacteriota bacterium]